MKRVLALLLSCFLLASPALAAEWFPAVQSYAGFADVAEDAWYTDAVKTCYEAGLMRGTSAETFSPHETMYVSEVATIAARMRAAINGETIPQLAPAQGQSREWYDDSIDYLTAAGVSVALPTQRATRAQFVAYLSAVTPQSELAAVNAITALPDSDNEAVLRFYNAGILTGVDDYGTFHAEGTLTRAECAAMVARILRPQLRQRFTLQEKPAEEAPSYQEELNSAMAIMVNGQSFSMSEFVNAMVNYIFEADYNTYVSTGQRLDWSADYGVGDLEDFFVTQTQKGMVLDAVLDQQAKAFACSVDDLAATLTPSPSKETLGAYAAGLDYLAAKHILIQTYDPKANTTLRSDEEAKALAQQIIDALDADPTPQQFQNLMALFNDDPGMSAYPQGYLFRPGEMVSEFETATRQLAVGAYTTQPVKSVYGYHIILRLDPADLDELKAAYQKAVLDSLAQSWADSATVTVNQVTLDKLKVQECYERYWELLRQQAGV